LSELKPGRKKAGEKIRKEVEAAGGDATRAVILHVEPKQRDANSHGRSSETRLAEAEGLARAIGLTIAQSVIAPLVAPRPATLIGSGKVDEIAQIVAERDAGLVIVNAQLSPIQQRNLERAWKAKVLDRTGLILEIFGERASTKEGTLQVELAHLRYQKSRLVRSWTHLERQRGAHADARADNDGVPFVVRAKGPAFGVGEQ